MKTTDGAAARRPPSDAPPAAEWEWEWDEERAGEGLDGRRKCEEEGEGGTTADECEWYDEAGIDSG